MRMACGCAMLALSACASNVYEPGPKFARFDADAEKTELTGSRIAGYGSPVEQSLGALAPTSVITPDLIDRYGESNLQRLLHRLYPNMVSGGGLDSMSMEPGRVPRPAVRE